ncbi:hypothetical protein Baya_0983 [Bagarius yarrelli]|uniref:Uncharacterized protein n=1 Tax=Bagarius yarrelli TaxID=175774 RepID=A0A556TJS8_BAGYA|nr:hypothetical protein Baya_0983 [Bagarius yarrelli]
MWGVLGDQGSTAEDVYLNGSTLQHIYTILAVAMEFQLTPTESLLQLNDTTKAKLSGKGPQAHFVESVEWVLACIGFSFTLGPMEKNPTSTTSSPDPIQTSGSAWGVNVPSGSVQDLSLSPDSAPVSVTSPYGLTVLLAPLFGLTVLLAPLFGLTVLLIFKSRTFF